MAKKVREEFVVYKDSENNYHGEQDANKTYTEVKLSVRRPNYGEKQGADFEYQKTFTKLLKEGILPRIKLEETIRETGIWDKTKEARERQLAKAINDTREKLKKGGIKLGEGVKLAKQSIKDNFEYIQLNMDRNSILNNSAESIAEQARFNHLTSAATVYNNDGVEKKFFKDYEDFLIQDSRGNVVTYLAGSYLSRLLNNFEDDFRKDWPEYKFLLKYKFVNDKFEYINAEGKPVDEEGNVVPETLPEDKTEVAEAVFLPD